MNLNYSNSVVYNVFSLGEKFHAYFNVLVNQLNVVVIITISLFKLVYIMGGHVFMVSIG